MMGPFVGFCFDGPAACRLVGDTTIDRRGGDTRGHECTTAGRRLWMDFAL
jgi:hypothetical protein